MVFFSQKVLSLLFAVLLGNSLVASALASGIPLDANAIDLPTNGGVAGASKVAEVAKSIISSSCLLVSPTNKDQTMRCIATMTDKLNLPAIADAKQASPLAMAMWLNADNLRDINSLSALKGLDLELLTRLLSDQLGQLLGGILPGSAPSTAAIKQAQKKLALNAVQTPGLSADNIVDLLMNNKILTDLAPGAPSLPSVPGVPSVPGMPSMPGVPSLPSVPGVPSVPSMPGMPSVPGAPSLPELPSISKTIPELFGLPLPDEPYTTLHYMYLPYARAAVNAIANVEAQAAAARNSVAEK